MVFKKILELRKINIAIDGYSGCGKSTLAKALAEKLGYIFIDSGAMFRGITHFCLINGVDVTDKKAIAEVLDSKPDLSFKPVSNHLLLNGQDVESHIRNDQKVVSSVSFVASIREVRTYLKELQQRHIAGKGVVMEGRDIGTVIMPGAELKIFITATIEERIHRRLSQLSDQGVTILEEEVRNNLIERDKADAGRDVAPLRKATDAICFDTSNFSKESQLEAVLAIARPIIEPDYYLPFIR